jgi:hypothetical protein
MASVSREQQRGGQRPATRRTDREARIARNLAGATVAAQLHDRLMSKTEAVETTGPDLTAERVERQLARQCNPLTAFYEPAAFAQTTKSQPLEPGDGLKAESVI